MPTSRQAQAAGGAAGSATPTSPMYSNGRLTAAHRDRLQRILNKQEMTTSTFKQAFRAPQRGYTPQTGTRPRRDASRVQTPAAVPTGASRRRVRVATENRSRPSTTSFTTRRNTKPPTPHHTVDAVAAATASGGRHRGRPASGGKTPVGARFANDFKKLTTSRSIGHLHSQISSNNTWDTRNLPLDKIQQRMNMASNGSNKSSSRSLRSQRTNRSHSSADQDAPGGGSGRGGSGRGESGHGGGSHREREREETPMTEPERNAHTNCFMRTRDNKFMPPGTPPISDEEVNMLLNQMRLKEQAARSKMPDRSPTATLLYGCRVESALSPEATPRPTRIMKEREAAKGVGGVNWISIVEHNQRLASRDDLRNEKMEKAVRQMFCKKLAQQRVEAQDALRDEVEDQRREKQRLSSMYEQWQQEDAEMLEQQRKRVQQLKMGYHQQLSAIEQRRLAEVDKWKRRERRQVDALKASLADEQAKNEQKKAENWRKMQQMVKENNIKIENRRAREMREAAEDIRLQQEYAAQLERQEIERRKAKAAIEERRTKSLENLMSGNKTFQQQAEEDEKRAEREHREARERMERIEREKRERLERNQRHTNAVILRQREEKEAQDQQYRAEWRLYGDYLNKDAELYAEEEEQHKKAQFRKCVKQNEVLVEQVKLNEQRRLAERADMSENERRYNQSLLNDCKKSLKIKATHAESPITTERMAKQVDTRSPFRWRVKHQPRPF